MYYQIRYSLHSLAFCLLSLYSFSDTAKAQSLVAEQKRLEQLDSQQQQRQQVQSELLQKALVNQPSLFSDKPLLTQMSFPQNEQPCFSLKEIQLLDYPQPSQSPFPPSQFQWAYEKALTQLNLKLPLCLGSQGLNVLMKTIQNQIIEKGFVTTRVVVGEQDLSSGKLQLTIISGRVGRYWVEDKSAGKRFTALTSWAGLAARQGQLLNVRDIEQSLENIKRVPTADVNINIIPAQNGEVGESDLLVQYAQRFPFRLTLGIDDAGSSATGRWQGSATLSIDHLLSANDLFYSSFTHSMKRPQWSGKDEASQRQSQSRHFHYSIPWRYWLLSVNHSQNRYHQQVAAAYGSKVRYSGESANSKLSLSRVIFRNHQHKTSATFSLWTKKSHNFINEEEVLVQRKRTSGWEIGLTHKMYLGNLTLDMGMQYKRGTGANNAIPYPESRFNEGTSRMQIINANLALTYPFQLAQQRFTLYSQWQGQWNKTDLVPQDYFSIGGRHTVRGTDGELSLSAERGWNWRNELTWQLGQTGQQLYVTFDIGQVSGSAVKELLGNRLIGASLGLRGNWKWLNYDVFAGKPIYLPTGFRSASSVLGFNLSMSF